MRQYFHLQCDDGDSGDDGSGDGDVGDGDGGSGDGDVGDGGGGGDSGDGGNSDDKEYEQKVDSENDDNGDAFISHLMQSCLSM